MATTTAEIWAFEIQKMVDGGYLVGDGLGRQGDYRQMRFASTSIDEALKYIKSRMEPKAPK